MTAENERKQLTLPINTQSLVTTVSATILATTVVAAVATFSGILDDVRETSSTVKLLKSEYEHSVDLLTEHNSKILNIDRRVSRIENTRFDGEDAKELKKGILEGVEHIMTPIKFQMDHQENRLRILEGEVREMGKERN